MPNYKEVYGGIGMAVILVALAVFFALALLFGACGALFDDEDVSLGQQETALMYPTDKESEPCQGEDSCQDRSQKGCAGATAPCSDDDKVTVIVCIHPSSCYFEGRPA